MENKREFKKYVDAVGGSITNEMMAAYYNIEGADREAISKAIQKVLCAVGTARCHANTYFDRGAKSFADKKEYAKARRAFFRALFNKINNDFAEAIQEALKEFNGAIPAAVKEANKA